MRGLMLLLMLVVVCSVGFALGTALFGLGCYSVRVRSDRKTLSSVRRKVLRGRRAVRWVCIDCNTCIGQSEEKKKKRKKKGSCVRKEV
jgi:hypothetical protein